MGIVFLMIFSLVFPSISFAGLVTVQEMAHQQTELSAQMLANLEKPEVQAKLQSLGISKAEAQQRLAALSEDEVRDLVQTAKNRQAGGDVWVPVSTILIIILIVLLLR
jgi:hypothetical protein